MKNLHLFLFLFLGFSIAGISQEYDSLLIEQNKILSRQVSQLRTGIQNLKASQQAISEEQAVLFQDLSDSLTNLEQETQRLHQILMDSLHRQNLLVQSRFSRIQTQTRITSRTHLIFQGIAFAILIGLIIYLILERRKSTEHLLRQTQKLGWQNNEMIEKAEQIETLKKSLSSMVKQQKKIKKRIKKKKK